MKKRRMLKPGGFHSGPGFRRTITVHGRDTPRTCARCGKKTDNAKHGFCPECRRSEEHTSELQSLTNLVCRLLLEKKKKHGENDRRRASSPARSPRRASHTRCDR